MKELLDDHILEQNVDLTKYRFRGSLAGKSWKREQATDRISMVRKVIFLMSALVFFPIIRNYLDFGEFDFLWFLERLVLSIILLLCGIFFHRFRLVAIIVAMLPILLILFSYLFFIDYFPLRIIGFNLAILFLMGTGIYFHFKEKKLIQFLVQKVKEQSQEVELRQR